MTRERIEIIRQSLIPYGKKELLKINYDGLGESDAKEFEKDLNEVLDLASKALEQPTSDDCVSRAEVFEIMGNLMSIPYDFDRPINEDDVSESMDKIKALPPVTPTQCIAAVRFSKEDLREICNERIEIECTHGTCKDCKNGFQTSFCSSSVYGCEKHKGVYKYDFYCADYEKRGNEE